MKERITTSIMWNNAAKAGLILGLFCIAYSFITGLLDTTQSSGFMSFLLKVLSFCLWLAKFAGCIYLVRRFMKKLCEEYDEVTNRTTRRFGIMIAATSALICAGYTMYTILNIDPKKMEEAISTAMTAYKGLLDSNAMAKMDNMVANLPKYAFFGTYIYCFLFGAILSVILSWRIPGVFDDTKGKQDNIEQQ